jgi:hypothetical protein
MHSWQRLTDDWVASEVGLDCLDFIESHFAPHVFGTSDPAVKSYRLAPSIITRSECEVLSLSAPRFAIRATFRDGSFVNISHLPLMELTLEELFAARVTLEQGEDDCPSMKFISVTPRDVRMPTRERRSREAIEKRDYNRLQGSSPNWATPRNETSRRSGLRKPVFWDFSGD